MEGKYIGSDKFLDIWYILTDGYSMKKGAVRSKVSYLCVLPGDFSVFQTEVHCRFIKVTELLRKPSYNLYI